MVPSIGLEIRVWSDLSRGESYVADGLFRLPRQCAERGLRGEGLQEPQMGTF